MGNFNLNKSKKIHCQFFDQDNKELDISVNTFSAKIDNWALNSIYKISISAYLSNYDYTFDISRVCVEINISSGKSLKFWGDLLSFNQVQSSELNEIYFEVIAPLNRLKAETRFDVYSNQSLKSIFKALFQKHKIQNFHLDFEDVIHQLEIQYYQSDFDIFTALTIQYGLIYRFVEIDGIFTLHIIKQVETPNTFNFTIVDDSQMVANQCGAYKLQHIQNDLPTAIRYRAEDENHRRNQFTAQPKELMPNQVVTDLYQLYACYTEEACWQSYELFLKQLNWQRYYIKFYTPILNMLPGDQVKIVEKHNGSAKYYYIIAINQLIHESLEPQLKYDKTYQLNIAIPINMPFCPVHPVLSYKSFNHISKQDQQHQVFLQNYKRAQLPLLKGEVVGKFGQSNVDERGNYSVKLSLNNNKIVVPIRKLSPYAGLNHSGSYGLHFPLYQGTKVIVGMINNCSQQLCILGTIYSDEQRDISMTSNKHEHILQTNSGSQLLFNDKSKLISLTIPRMVKVSINGYSEDEKIELHSLSGCINMYSKFGCQWYVGGDLFIKGKSVIINSNNKISLSSIQQQLYADNAYRTQSDRIMHKASKAEISSHALGLYAQKSMYILSNRIYIRAKEIKLNAKNKVIFHAQESLMIESDEAYLSMNNKGEIISNGKINFNFHKLEKHIGDCYFSKA